VDSILSLDAIVTILLLFLKTSDFDEQTGLVVFLFCFVLFFSIVQVLTKQLKVSLLMANTI
jgi:hypothetical protein